MIKLANLSSYLDNFFGPELIAKARLIDTHMPNGLQWRGKEEIKKICLGVSASCKLFEQASERNSDAVIVHHGLSVDTPYNLFSYSLQQRIKILTQNNISLFGFHYVLDSHPEFGNNSLVLKDLGAKKTSKLHDEWGWAGEFANPVSINSVKESCQKLFGHDVFIVKGRKEIVKRIGVVTGRGVPFQNEKLELMEKGIELYITGEISEWNVREFEEMGITYLSCGHYNTEKIGIKYLTDKLKEKFNELDFEFIDIPNEI